MLSTAAADGTSGSAVPFEDINKRDPQAPAAFNVMQYNVLAGPPNASRTPRSVSSVSSAGGADGAEASFQVRKILVKARLSTTGLSLEPASAWGRACPWSKQRIAVPFEDILGAEVSDHTVNCLSAACCEQVHGLVVHAIKRTRKRKYLWRQRRIYLASPDGDLVQEWAARIRGHLQSQQHRPRQLLILINPFGGARTAKQIWAQMVQPIFSRAGIDFTTIETERELHAREVVEKLDLADLQRLDGIVAIGGDGLFQEVLNGILALRKSHEPEHRKAAEDLRLGHIPAGSTDAVAFSVHGTRDTLTATLHIALGDRMALDIMRIDTEDGQHRYATCVASYGYMGDLMRLSERLRWMGPSRYNFAGAVTLFEGRSYHAKVSYLPVSSESLSRRQVCYADCELCHGSHAQPGSPHRFTRPSVQAAAGWRTCEGRFKSIMAVLMPCRSDRSALGLAPFSHLADGRLQLIMVRQCSRAAYLRFLASIPSHGVQEGRFPFVDIVEATAVQVTPSGRESWWNVDGELLANNHMSAEVHRGLLSVFGRGIEN